ncbi:GNAT family N-acetyltransferase [Arenibacter sp. GZD96]|uniref:GNAT family N-acetyltransferase n=1 Tax=Aurantibrevibacter litoralis TaxID=3106030 RepID=UPI002B0009DA|nr:GNAT family N-acetyltransferase [Arenibacter sp. GZD-96]MEA1786689.1 GNAT family N-acetyltransferase [Arenibacter sp. GZD-96]
MDKKIRIREAVLSDLKALLHFEQGVIAAERPYDLTLRDGTISYYNLAQLIASDRAVVVVAEDDGVLVGSGHATIKRARHYLNHEEYVNLGFMYTVPEHRGKGINKKIIEALTAWAASKGLYEIRLTVYCDNAAAIKAYEKAGFRKHILQMRLA